MKTNLVIVCHMNAQVLDWSINKLFEHPGITFDRKIIVNNRYPLKYEETRAKILELALKYKMTIVEAEKNEGGPAGFKLGLYSLPGYENELVYGVDPDCNPVSTRWAKAMKDVMENSDYDAVHLMHEHILERPWRINLVTGAYTTYKMATLGHPEMENMTCWRGSFLKEHGLRGKGFYGFNETETKKKSDYLYDYRETLPMHGHDKEYNDWKRKHAFAGYEKNFDEYIKEFC